MTHVEEAAGRANSVADVVRIHHVEIYVANLRQAIHFYRTILGFRVLGPIHTAATDRSSVALGRGRARLVLTAPLTASSDVSAHVHRHGEGVKDIALTVREVHDVFRRAVAAGAQVVADPVVTSFAGGQARIARIASCGSLVHSLIEPLDTDGGWLSPVRQEGGVPDVDTALDGLDHVAIAVRAGELDRTVEFYRAALGLVETHAETVGTEYTAMRSKVVGTTDGSVRFPLLEPALGARRSQIDVFLQAHDGPGVQHLAFESRDIVGSVRAMGDGVEFLPPPPPYYESVEARLGQRPAEFETLSRHGILIDSDATGVLLQVFTKPIGTRPTLFLEIVERRGATGFGSGNIKALFEAVERLQLASS